MDVIIITVGYKKAIKKALDLGQKCRKIKGFLILGVTGFEPVSLQLKGLYLSTIFFLWGKKWGKLYPSRIG